MSGPVAELFRQYHASLVRMLYRRTGDRERAEEIAQETFARAVAAPPRNPRPWLFAVALNLIREWEKLKERQAQWRNILAGVLGLTLSLVYGAIAILEFRQNLYVSALLRSFGAPPRSIPL